ncbi:MAG: restriction endonuclease subunit S [Methanoregula sp.]|jgi:type I restriction enzyme S subunit|nr:restriction endonuclease subunit S [Methanoregula sp.]
MTSSTKNSDHVPNVWNFGTVSEFFDVITGTTPPTKEIEFWNHGTIQWFTPADLSKLNGRVHTDNSERHITPKGLKYSNLEPVPKESIIISTRAPVGSIAITSEPATFNQGCKGLVPKDPQTTESIFYYYYLLLNRENLVNRSGGSTFKELSKDLLEQFPVPHPPIQEQRHIAAILTNVDDAIQRSRQAAAEMERLKAGVMQKLMTKGIGHTEFREDPDVGIVPKEWNVKKLGEISDIVSGGTPSRNEKKFWNGNIPWIKTGEINYNIICNTEEKITQAGLENSAARIIPKGTLLMALYGQGVTRGRVAITGIEATINQACAAIMFKEEVDMKFIFYFLSGQYHAIRTLSGGSNQNNLNIPLIKSVAISIPPLPEQQQISTILSTLDHKLSLQRQRTAHYERLKQGLMNELLTGNRRVQVM